MSHIKSKKSLQKKFKMSHTALFLEVIPDRMDPVIPALCNEVLLGVAFLVLTYRETVFQGGMRFKIRECVSRFVAAFQDS